MPKVQEMGLQHMETTYLVVFSIVAGALLVISALSTLFCLVRLNELAAQVMSVRQVLGEQAPQKQIEKAVITAEGSRDRIDTALIELAKYREGIKGEMQRFYAIMRRNEKAASTVDAQTPSGQDGESGVPDEVDASSFKNDEKAEEQISKADLRKLARSAGL